MRDTHHTESPPLRGEIPIEPDHTMATHPDYGEIGNLNHDVLRREDGEYQIVLETPDGKKVTLEDATFAWGGTQEGPGRAVCVGMDVETKKLEVIHCPPGTKIYKINKPAQKPKYYD